MADLDENLLKRVMPHDDETERSLLGALIMDQEEIPVACEYVTPQDFYNKQYGAAFEAITALYNSGMDVDPVTLHNKLSSMDVPPEAATMEFISLLVNSVTISGNAKYYAQAISDKAMKRKLIRVCEDIASTCYADKTDLPEVLEKTEKNVFDLSQSTRSSDFVPIRDVVANTMAMIEKASKTKGGITGIPTGFVDLDNKLMGLHPSDLVLIAARPSMGKTALVLNMAENMAFRQNRAIAIFSLEMPKEILAQRLLSMNSRVDSQNIRSGQLAKSEWHDIIESAGNLASSKLIIDDNTSNISVAEIRSRARRYKLEYNIEAIMIDYLQLMSGSGSGRNDSRQQEISEISRGLKGIARELNIPVIALSQLSRAVEQRSDHRPMLSDLRESGAIEQDADVVMFIYREDYYNEDTDRKGISEIIIAKQRNGPIGTVDLAWIPSLTKFANLDHSAKREE
ncbi:MAG: replicative DNA helicase [Lachnospiraceae bacterium]|nr:replicative DNA helicase [Lachnospiraceae bacterium]